MKNIQIAETNEYSSLKLWTLIKNVIKSIHKFRYNIFFTFLMDRGRAPNGIGHLMILSDLNFEWKVFDENGSVEIPNFYWGMYGHVVNILDTVAGGE